MAHKVSSELPVLPADPNLLLAPRPIVTMTQSDAVVPPLAQRQPSYPPITYGQVMTDEQLETLRRQISVYATICQQLVEMHKAIMAQQSAIPGLRLGQSIPFDPCIHSNTQKLTSRQRWTPSPTQLQILEKLFDQGSGTPNKQRIKEITTELSMHGQISETNVYNWFQNRRARTKRKQQLGGLNNGESELDTDVDSPEEKKTKVERDISNESFGAGQPDMNFQSYDSKEHHHFDTQSQVHPQLDNSGMSFNRTIVDGQRYGSGNLSGVSLMANNKPWEVKTDPVGPLALENSEAHMVIGAEESLKLLHSAEKYSFAE